MDAECLSSELLCRRVGNVIFLPRGAVVIDIVPENNEDKSPWVVYMCADFKPLFISPITIPPQKTVLQMAKVRRTKEWAMLSPYWRQRILREGVCPEVHYAPLTGLGRRTISLEPTMLYMSSACSCRPAPVCILRWQVSVHTRVEDLCCDTSDLVCRMRTWIGRWIHMLRATFSGFSSREIWSLTTVKSAMLLRPVSCMSGACMSE